jgi:hypothetical protein
VIEVRPYDPHSERPQPPLLGGPAREARPHAAARYLSAAPPCSRCARRRVG